jgi:hypothetical protein
MKRLVIGMVMVLGGVAVLWVCTAAGKDKSNPTFMAIYRPQSPSSLDRDARMVAFAEQSINGVFVRRGFRVLDRAVIESTYKKLPKSEQPDQDLAELAAQSKADMLLIYDVKAEKTELPPPKPYDNLQINISLRAVSPATADLIAQDNSRGLQPILKTSANYQDDISAAKKADEVGKSVADKLVDDVFVVYVNRGYKLTR